MNKYLVAISIESSLSSSEGDVELKQNGIPVILKFSERSKDGKYFPAFLDIKGQNYKEAGDAATSIVDDVCDVVAFIMKSSLMPIGVSVILKDEKGKNERVVYRQTTEERTFGAWFFGSSKTTIQQLLDVIKDDKSNLSLRWLRYGHRSRGLIEQFTYYWLALERLVGEKQIQRICKCGEDFSYSGIDKDGIWKLLQNRLPYKSIDRGEFEKMWSIRQMIFHGGKKPDTKLLDELRKINKLLLDVVERDLLVKFQPEFQVGNEEAFPVSRPHHEYGLYKFTTSHPDEKYALDYPTDEQLIKFRATDEVESPERLEVLPYEDYKDW